MPRIILALFLAGLPLALPAQDSRVPYLEQEVRRLERELQALSRRIDELERPVRAVPGNPMKSTPPLPTSDTWLDAGKWQRVRAGMSELEVIGLLGPPTSMREENGVRVLLYAREIGASGFLGGSVRLRERAVIEVRPPVLQ